MRAGGSGVPLALIYSLYPEKIWFGQFSAITFNEKRGELNASTCLVRHQKSFGSTTPFGVM
jgi:hypothetical protein